jgi:succinoglycan biosynthesis protein ExoL
MRVGYLVHDTTDSTVRRRVRMLKAAGADVVVVGFRRAEAPPLTIEGAEVVDLGRTHDARLGHRAISVLTRLVKVKEWSKTLVDADVILARNLEMLTLAVRAQKASPKSRLAYEVLDVHRSLLSNALAGRALRALERRFMRRSDLLVVSSPAFLHGYFKTLQGFDGPSFLIENKVLNLKEGGYPPPVSERREGPPWRIGWFGNIRCRKSLQTLIQVASKLQGRVEVVIRGRPARGEFNDFDAEVAAAPHVSFEGPYRAEDLPNIYGDVHFVWAVDYFEEGLNSAWLLPCRLYEGTLHGAVPMAQHSVETGRWLEEKGVGVLFQDPVAELLPFMSGLTRERYSDLFRGLTRVPRADLQAEHLDCRRLTGALAGRAPRG